jgi:hypothetical protein
VLCARAGARCRTGWGFFLYRGVVCWDVLSQSDTKQDIERLRERTAKCNEAYEQQQRVLTVCQERLASTKAQLTAIDVQLPPSQS